MFSVEYKGNYICVLAKHTMKPEKNYYVALKFDPLIMSVDKLVDKKAYIVKTLNNLVLKGDPKVYLTRKYVGKNKESESDSFFIPLEDKDVEEKNKLCELSLDGESENSFKIEKLSDSEKQDIFFAKSCVPLMEYFVRIFIKKDKKKFKPSTCRKVEKLLKRICCFVFDQKYRRDVDVMHGMKGNINKSRQKILREMGIIDYLTDFVEKPFSTEDFFDLKKLKQDMFITKVLRLSYVTIKYIIRENPANELYCSQWLNLFLVQTLRTHNENEIEAQGTLTELIYNNRRILDTRLRKETMNKFIQLVSSDKISKYLDILRVTIVCDTKPMKNNQREISKLVLRDDKMSEKLLYIMEMTKSAAGKANAGVTYRKSVKEEPKEIELLDIERLTEEKIPKGEIVKETGNKQLDASNTYDFFVALIWLLGDLCLERNYLAIDTIQTKYRFDMCREVALNPKLSYKLRESFFYLIHHLWIDVAPARHVEIPILKVNWDQLDNSKPIDNQGQSTKHIRKFVFDEDLYLNDSEPHRELKTFKTELMNQLLNGMEPNELLHSLGIGKGEDKISCIITSLEIVLKMMNLRMISNQEAEKVSNLCMKFINSIYMEIIPKNEAAHGAQNVSSKRSKLIQLGCMVCYLFKMLFKYELNSKKDNILKNIKDYLNKCNQDKLNAIKNADFTGVSLNDSSQKDQLSKVKSNGSETNKLIERIDADIEEMFEELIKSEFCWKFSQTTEKNVKIVEELLKLSLIDDELLTRLAIEMIHLIYSQRSEMRSCLKSIMFMDSKTEKQYNEIKFVASNLTLMSETAEKWFLSPSEKELDQLKQNLKELEKYISKNKKHIVATAEIIRKEVNETDIEGAEGEDRKPDGARKVEQQEGAKKLHYLYRNVIDFYFTTPNKYNQDLYRHLRVAESLMEILNWDVMYHEYHSKHYVKDILRPIYKILSYMVLNNEENHKTILPFFNRIILPHFNRDDKIGCIPFMNHFLINNFNLIKDEYAVTKLTNELFEKIKRCNVTDPHFAFYLNIIANIVIIGKQASKTTNNLVLRMLFEGSNIQTKLEDDLSLRGFVTASDAIRDEPVQKLPNKHLCKIIPPHACFIISIINLLCTCCEGDTAFCDSISQNIIPLNACIEILKSPNVDILLKKIMVKFMIQVYITVEKENIFHLQELVTNGLLELLDDFKSIIGGEFKSSDDEIFLVSMNSCLTRSRVVHGYLSALTTLIKEILKRNISASSQSIAYEKMKKFIQKLIALCQGYRKSNSPDSNAAVQEILKCIMENHLEDYYQYTKEK